MSTEVIVDGEMEYPWEYEGIEDDWHVWRKYNDNGDIAEEKAMPVKDTPEDFKPEDDPPVDAWESDLGEK